MGDNGSDRMAENGNGKKTYTRLIVTLVLSGLAQWSLAMHWIDGAQWMAVVTLCAAAFGVTKGVEYFKK